MKAKEPLTNLPKKLLALHDKVIKPIPEVTFRKKGENENLLVARILRSGRYYELNVFVTSQERFDQLEEIKRELDAEEKTGVVMSK